MVAASTSANTLNYWTWNGSTWSSVSTYTFTSTMANIHWVKMASKPGANQIALFVADSGKKGNALIWSGSSWGNELNLTSSLSSITTEAIAVQYINGGGTYAGYAVFVWAESTQLKNYKWNGTSWLGSGSQSTSGVPYWVRLKADPNSGYMLLVYEASDGSIYARSWATTSFSAALQITAAAYGNYLYNRPFDFAFTPANDFDATNSFLRQRGRYALF